LFVGVIHIVIPLCAEEMAIFQDADFSEGRTWAFYLEASINTLSLSLEDTYLVISSLETSKCLLGRNLC